MQIDVLSVRYLFICSLFFWSWIILIHIQFEFIYDIAFGTQLLNK